MIAFPRPGCALLLLLLLVFGGIACSAQEKLIEPQENQVYVSNRCITCLAATPEGDVWAGTNGGIVQWETRSGKWKRHSCADGLPLPEVRGIAVEGNKVTVLLPAGAASWNGQEWQPEEKRPAPPLSWREQPVSVGIDGLRIGSKMVPMPPSTVGSHFSAVAPSATGNLLAAVFGEARLYRWNGVAWSFVPCDLPDEAGKEITALLQTRSGTTYIGTRRHGLFMQEGENAPFKSIEATTEGPFDHDAQALMRFQGCLYISTLEDGLCRLSDRGWEHITVPTISTNAPRQMAVFQNRLYLRHGNGKVDAFDGASWNRDVFAALPRKQVSALAADGNSLHLAQWGGWSDWDGRSFAHHLNLPELQGVPLTAVCADPECGRLWIGTQGKGLAEADLQTGTIRRWHNEQNGLTDDWITEIACLASPNGSRTLIGTFVGGLCEQDMAGRWQGVPGTEGENITGIACAENKVVVATRHGVRCLSDGKSFPASPVSDRTEEAQCLCAGESGVWIGTRTGIRYLSLAASKD